MFVAGMVLCVFCVCVCCVCVFELSAVPTVDSSFEEGCDCRILTAEAEVGHQLPRR